MLQSSWPRCLCLFFCPQRFTSAWQRRHLVQRDAICSRFVGQWHGSSFPCWGSQSQCKPWHLNRLWGQPYSYLTRNGVHMSCASEITRRKPLDEVALEQLAKAGPKGRLAWQQRQRGHLLLTGTLSPRRTEQSAARRSTTSCVPEVSTWDWAWSLQLRESRKRGSDPPTSAMV